MTRKRYLYNPLSSASASHSAKARAAYPDIAPRVLAILRANPPSITTWDDWHADTTAPWLESVLGDVPRLTLGAVLHTMEHDGFIFRLWNYVGTTKSSAHPYVATDFRYLITDQANQIMPLSPPPPNLVLHLIYEEPSCSPAIQKVIEDYRLEQANQRRANRPQRTIFARRRIIKRRKP